MKPPNKTGAEPGSHRAEITTAATLPTHAQGASHAAVAGATGFKLCEPMSDPLPELCQLLGPAVFIAWPKGVKASRKKWGHLNLKHMTPEYLAGLKDGNIGVALGEVSQGLVAIDADCDEFAQSFLSANPHLDGTLSTHGNRGRVFWLRFDGDYPRRTVKLRTHAGEAVGEFRSDGSQSIVWGTHPDTNKPYEFVVRRPVAVVKFQSIRWPATIANPPTLQRDGDTDVIISVCSASLSLCLSVKSVAQAVEIALPDRVHTNNACLFKLARAVKALEVDTGPLSRQQRMEVFSQWYAETQARGLLREGQTRDDYLVEFMNACKKAKFPLGASPAEQAWKLAAKEPLPAEADVFESPEGKLLVALCYQLHRLAEGEPWFLAARTAASLTGRSHTAAATWLSALVQMGILEVVAQYTANKATRYRYIAQ